MNTENTKAVEAFVSPVTKMAKDDLKIGSWYWVMVNKVFIGYEKDGVHNGNGFYENMELLMCVEHIGSNFIEFLRWKCCLYTDRYDVDDESIKIHFDDFFKRCRPEPNWEEHLKNEMSKIQNKMREKTQELISKGKELCLLNGDAPTQKQETLLPACISIDPNAHKEALIQLRNTLPIISKEIKRLGGQFSAVSKNLSLPEIIDLKRVQKSLNAVEDRIFTVELYCGLQEQVKKISEGDPAPENEPIAIRQQMLYMDEETLWDYESGGMDSKSLDKFDEWIVKPTNLNRLLPEQRGIVAFRIRRSVKDYGNPDNIATMFYHMEQNEKNMKTYLLIRNGNMVYRIASAVDFSPRLIPKIDEVGEAQFKRIVHGARVGGEWWAEREEIVETVTPKDMDYDASVEKLDQTVKHYNKIVILLQGLLDRSEVFFPHPRINLCDTNSFDQWTKLIRDEERALPSPKINWEEYQKILNEKIKVGTWISIDQYTFWGLKDKKIDHYGKMSPYRKGWNDNPMPKYCKVTQIKRDKSQIKVSWKKGNGRWHYDKNGRWTDYCDRLIHEWIPVDIAFNVEAYTRGDFRIFLFNHDQKVEYRKWAKFLLPAEDWVSSEKIRQDAQTELGF